MLKIIDISLGYMKLTLLLWGMETTLREQIKKSGLKQNFIAKRLSISKEHLNRMLKDNEVPDKYKIEIVRLLSNVE